MSPRLAENLMTTPYYKHLPIKLQQTIATLRSEKRIFFWPIVFTYKIKYILKDGWNWRWAISRFVCRLNTKSLITIYSRALCWFFTLFHVFFCLRFNYSIPATTWENSSLRSLVMWYSGNSHICAISSQLIVHTFNVFSSIRERRFFVKEFFLLFFWIFL